jgi:hypothetical protein
LSISFYPYCIDGLASKDFELKLGMIRYGDQPQITGKSKRTSDEEFQTPSCGFLAKILPLSKASI